MADSDLHRMLQDLRRVDGFAQALVFMFEGLGFRAQRLECGM